MLPELITVATTIVVVVSDVAVTDLRSGCAAASGEFAVFLVIGVPTPVRRVYAGLVADAAGAVRLRPSRWSSGHSGRRQRPAPASVANHVVPLRIEYSIVAPAPAAEPATYVV